MTDIYIYIFTTLVFFLLFQRDMWGGVSFLQRVTSAVSHCQLCSGVTEGVGDGHQTSAGETTHGRFNKVHHTGSSTLTVLSRAL